MALDNAEKLFQRMLEMPGIHPDVHSYASLLSSLTKSGDQPSGVNRAADILLGMEQALDDSFSREGLTNATMPSVVPPNAICYNTVIHGYSKSKRPMEAEEWLCRMVERRVRYPLVAPAPNERTFNAAMLAWAKSGRRDSGRKAQDLLEVIEAMAKENGKIAGQRAAVEATVQPDIIGYNIVLDGWRLGSSIKSAMGAEKLLRSMERRERFAIPDRTSYNTVIDAFCKAGRSQHRKQQHHQGRRQMETTDIIFAQRAEDLLYQMDAAGVPPDTWSFNTVLHAWARSGLGQKAADHATALLLTMEQLHQQDGTKRSTNDGIVHPDARSYSAVIDAIARSGATDAPGRAAAILSRMEDNGILPNAYTLNGILNCWAKNSRNNVFAAQEADGILRRMEESDGDQKSYPKPDLVSYCIVTVAFAWNQSDANKATKARDVLDRMLKYVHSHGLQEERHTRDKLQSAYNSVLSACAHMPRSSNADDLERAREIALQTYDELSMSSLVEPNEETYYVFLLICGNLFKGTFVRNDGNNASKSKRLLLETAMQECFDRGLASERVRKRFAEHQPNPVIK
jgi:pentatricopeptide repeat protein